jgi:hypothetical protein
VNSNSLFSRETELIVYKNIDKWHWIYYENWIIKSRNWDILPRAITKLYNQVSWWYNCFLKVESLRTGASNDSNTRFWRPEGLQFLCPGLGKFTFFSFLFYPGLQPIEWCSTTLEEGDSFLIWISFELNHPVILIPISSKHSHRLTQNITLTTYLDVL